MHGMRERDHALGEKVSMRLITEQERTQVAKARKKRWEGPFGKHLKYLECFWPPFLLQCQQCHADFLVERCADCSSVEEFEIRQSAEMFGAFCRYCPSPGLYTWGCPECRVENRLPESLVLLE